MIKPTLSVVAAAAAAISLASVAHAKGTGDTPLMQRTAEFSQPSLIFGVDRADQGAQLVKAQWLFGGRNYCFYDYGWRGPGYYWCGYAYRRGFGWGGPLGWHGWGRSFHGGGYYHGRGYYHGGGYTHGGYRGGGFHDGGFHGGDHHDGGFHGGGDHHDGGDHHGGGDHHH